MSTTTPKLAGLLRSAAAAAIVLASFSASAHAAGANAQIHSDGFSTSWIKVVSENGTSWTKIVKGDFALPVKIKIGMPGFSVAGYIVSQSGQPDGKFIAYGQPSDAVDLSTIYIGQTDYLSAAERQAIIASCNTNLGKGKGIRESHNMFGNAGVELRAQFAEKGSASINGYNTEYVGEPHVSKANVAVHVKCEGKPEAADDLAAKEPNFGVKGIHLRFATSAGYPTKPNLATRCQMAEAKVRLETSKEGSVKFKLWTKVGNGPMQSQFVEAWSSFVGPGKYEAKFSKSFTVDKSTTVQAMAEDLTNSIGQSTGWKDVKVNCTGAGGGGFSGTPGNANPDNLPPANPKAPFRVVPGVAVGTKVAPIPPRPAPQTRPHLGQHKTAPMPHAVAAKDRFYPSKPHVN